MSYLVDTNVISELRKGDRCNRSVAIWFERLRPDEIFLSVLNVGELRRGIELIRRRDAAAAEALEDWLVGLVRDHGERVLPVDREVASEIDKIINWLDARIAEVKPPKPDHSQYEDNDWSS